MKLTVNKHLFHDYMGARTEHKFGFRALNYLFEYYEEVDPDMELDPIAIACDWGEYDNEEELLADYPEGLAELKRRTCVVELPGGAFLVQAY